MSVQVEQSFNDDFIENQLKIMIEMVDRSPTDAIGKAKELVESCFKYILDFKGISYSKNDDLGDLRKLTFLELNIDSNTNVDATVNNNIKKLLSSLNQIVSSIGELRNIKVNLAFQQIHLKRNQTRSVVGLIENFQIVDNLFLLIQQVRLSPFHERP